ncbi:Mitochondrial genome maintenance exonuclease 1 [Bulinus truncatus]|nr:Mitochondrial genome maintenance exonuclease 1 [Bulinus truncatus]
MALNRCTQVFRFSVNIMPSKSRTYSFKRRVTKKQYSFDLDSLIQWKKETNHVFGAERKLTKSGKIKKNKKNNSLDENLSILSAYSDFTQLNVPENDNNTVKVNVGIPEQILSPSVPLPEVHAISLSQSMRSRQSENLPMDNDAYSKFGYKKDIYSLENKLKFSEIKGDFNSALNENEVKIKAADEHHPQSLDQTTLTKNKALQHTGSLNTKDKQLSVFNILNHNQANRTFTDKTESSNELSEIFIPKLAPIPQHASSTIHQPLINNVGQVLPQLDTSNLPIEPPNSFNVISKVPLFPKDGTLWPEDADLEQLKAFHNDLKLLNFRAPPSVKSILSKSMPDINRFFLERWREKLIKELGAEGFQQHQEATIKRGINLHANITDYLSGKPINEIQIMPDNQGHWVSLQSTLKILSDVKAVEGEVLNPFLLYRGVFDCIAKYKDLLCIIDWKVSKKPRPFLKDTYDDPLQIVAYMGAVNASEKFIRKFGQVNNGMIVVVYPDGSPAHVHIINKSTSKDYWMTWKDRLYEFYQLAYTEKFGPKINKSLK